MISTALTAQLGIRVPVVQAPFVINLFTSPQPGEVKDQRAALDAVAHFYGELGLGTPQPVQPPYAAELIRTLEQETITALRAGAALVP